MKNNNIPIIQQYLNFGVTGDMNDNSWTEDRDLESTQAYNAMIAFAKFHVQEALKQAAEKAYAQFDMDSSGYIEGNIWIEIDKDSILTSYNLDDIK